MIIQTQILCRIDEEFHNRCVRQRDSSGLLQADLNARGWVGFIIEAYSRLFDEVFPLVGRGWINNVTDYSPA